MAPTRQRHGCPNRARALTRHPAPPDNHWIEACAAAAGTALAAATLGLSLLADIGWFRLPLVLAVVAASLLPAFQLWRPALRLPQGSGGGGVPPTSTGADDRRVSRLGVGTGVAILVVGALLVAPGSEHIVGPRDPGVYAATAFALGEHGALIYRDPPVALVAETVPAEETGFWMYRHFVNRALLRFPAPFFLRADRPAAERPGPTGAEPVTPAPVSTANTGAIPVGSGHEAALTGNVEGGFLPGLIVWAALAAQLGGLEPLLHVSGVFGVLATGFAMLATRAATRPARSRIDPNPPSVSPEPAVAVSCPQPLLAVHPATSLVSTNPALGPDPISTDRVPSPGRGAMTRGAQSRSYIAALLVGAMLVTSFAQIWWAREVMAESTLGAFTWLSAWALLSWRATGDWRWSFLGALGAVAGLFTRADGVLLAGGVALVLLLSRKGPGRLVALGLLTLGCMAYAAHAVVIAPTYLSLTYGAFTASRAQAGIAVVLVAGLLLLLIRMARGRSWVRPLEDGLRRAGLPLRLVATALLIAVGLLLVTGVAPGVGREPTAGAPSPLAWLPGYLPWPFLALAGFGLLAVFWGRHWSTLWPLLLLGGIPALFYLPDPLVTGDHPWMVRRLVPAAIPFLALLAALGATELYRAKGFFRRFHLGRQLVAAGLFGLGLGLAVIQIQSLITTPRNGSGIAVGLDAIASLVPPNAVVVFPSSEASLALAMPLEAVHGIGTLAVPSASLSPSIARVLGQWDASGIEVYWADTRGGATAVLMGVGPEPVGQVHLRWTTADGSPVPPPLRLRTVDVDLTLLRLHFDEVVATRGTGQD